MSRSLAAVLTGWHSWWHLSEAMVESKRAGPHHAVTGPLSESKALRVGLQREWSGQEVLSYPSKLEVFAVFGGDVPYASEIAPVLIKSGCVSI